MNFFLLCDRFTTVEKMTVNSMQAPFLPIDTIIPLNVTVKNKYGGGVSNIITPFFGCHLGITGIPVARS